MITIVVLSSDDFQENFKLYFYLFMLQSALRLTSSESFELDSDESSDSEDSDREQQVCC